MRILAILAAAVAISALLFLTRPQSQAGLKPPIPPYITTVVVQQEDVQTIVTIAARLQPARIARLPFEVAGQVIERRVEPGQAVAQGEVLLLIDSGDYEDALAEARALLALEDSAIARDKKLLALARQERIIMQRELERLGVLEQRALASESRFEQARNRLLGQQQREAALQHSVDTAAARRARLQAGLNRARRALDRTRLAAPFAGVVSRVSAEVGDYVNRAQVAAQLVQIDQLDAYLEITGAQAGLLSLDQPVSVRHGEQIISGRIIAINPDPDAATNTHALRIRLPAQGLYPGAIVQVDLPGAFFTAVATIPAAALLREAGQDYVYTVEQGRTQRLPVALLAGLPARYVIQGKGIVAGTIIAAEDVAALHDGQAVSVSAVQ